MDFSPIPEIIDGLPNISGHEAQVEAITSKRDPVYLRETPLRLDRLQAVCAIALHMQQPLIPAGGDDLATADTISNLDHMARNPGIGDNHNAGVFAECYARMGEIIPEMVHQGKNARVMFDYSGELLYGVIATETSNSITMKLPGNITRSVLRSEISTLTSTGTSLMPDGLEAALTPQTLADLIAYLKKVK